MHASVYENWNCMDWKTHATRGHWLMIIGLNLAPVTIKSVSTLTRGWQSLPFYALVPLLLRYDSPPSITHRAHQCLFFLLTNILGLGKPIDFNTILHGLAYPLFTHLFLMPKLDCTCCAYFSRWKLRTFQTAMTERSLSPYMGRAFFAFVQVYQLLLVVQVWRLMLWCDGCN